MKLNSIMDFDHVIEVTESGRIIDRDDLYAPSLLDDELDTDGWALLDGYSGQDSYSGPVMNNAEFIGGRMEDDIRSTPGIYVAIVAYWSPEEEDEDEDLLAEGWAVAYRATE
jgi:hypothetical protein